MNAPTSLRALALFPLLCAVSTAAQADWFGVPLGSPNPLNSNAAFDTGGDFDPQIATDGRDVWVTVWFSTEDLNGAIGTDRDILFARSIDGGETWGDPQVLNSNAAVDSGRDYRPTIATDGKGVWVVVWTSEDVLDGSLGTDADLLLARSIDNGQTWSDPHALNSNAASDSQTDQNAHIATDGFGNWVVVWDAVDDDDVPDEDIHVAISSDNGLNWSAAVLLYNYAADDTGADLFPAVATDRCGNWVTVWSSYDSIDGTVGNDGDILASYSDDEGASWTFPVAVNHFAHDDGDVDQFPSIATDGLGTWMTVWVSRYQLTPDLGVSDFDLLSSVSTNNGSTWSNAVPVNFAGGDAGGDTRPRLAADAMGNWVTVWHSQDSLGGSIGDDVDTLVSRSMDDGQSWSDPTPLNTNAADDQGHDRYPWVATDGGECWVAVWRSNDQLDGTLDADWDILSTRFHIRECLGDFDGDGTVTLDDLVVLLKHYELVGIARYEDGDLDGDADVDIYDLAIFLSLYGSPCTSQLPVVLLP